MGEIIGFLKDNFLHVAPILLAGAFALAIIAERLTALLVIYPLSNPTGFLDKVRDLVMANRVGEAVTLCEKYKGKPMAKVVKQALLRAHQPESMIEDGLESVVLETHEQIQNRTPYIATIANVSTLLGLFGTIVGLIHSFEAVGSANAQQKAALLAAGISTAMNATMMGLAVAIPSMVAFSFLMNKTNKLTAQVNHTAVKILDIIKQRYYDAEMQASGHQKKAG
jgi:biopolymer transport protein ExbB/TolQ